LLVLVPVVVFVTPLAPRPASCRVVAAPRRCVASRAGIRVIIPRAYQALCSELSVLPLGEVVFVGGPKMKKDGFPGRDSWDVAALGRPVL